MEVLDDNTLDLLDKRIEEARISFEQYFMGSRKRAPEQQRTSVLYLIRRLANQHTPNTKIRFRFQQLTAKFNAYNQYWNRVLNQMESGKYRRDQFKAQLRARPVDERAAPKPAATQDAGEGQQIDRLYNDLVQARKQLNQPTDSISKEKLAATIKKQMPKLQEKYKGKQVEFKVVVENGQAKLKVNKG